MTDVLRGAGHILSIMTNEESEPQPLDLRGLVDLSDPEALSVQAREFVAQIRRALRLD